MRRKVSPRCAREGAGTRTPQVRRVRQGGLVGDRHRHPAQAGPVRRSSGQRSGAALMTTTEAPVKYEYDRIPYLVAYQNTSGVRDTTAGSPSWWCWRATCSAEDEAVGHRAGVHAPDRRRRLPADDQRAGPRGPPRHLLQQPVPRHRLGAADGEGRRGPRRVHQGRQEPAGLFEGRAGRLERRRLAVGVLPAAGQHPTSRQPVRRRA